MDPVESGWQLTSKSIVGSKRGKMAQPDWRQSLKIHLINVQHRSSVGLLVVSADAYPRISLGS